MTNVNRLWVIACACGFLYVTQASAVQPPKDDKLPKPETPIIGDTTAACESLNEGQLRYTASRLQICSRGSWTDLMNDFPKMVFLSSTVHTGNLGEVAGADMICQDLAETAGLYGTYKAWISDSESEPSTSFKHSEAPYTLVDETVVADNWVDLTDSDIKVPINLDEYGNVVVLNENPLPGDADNAGAWTATSWDGTRFIIYDEKNIGCDEWTNGSSQAQDEIQGMFGLPYATSASWSSGLIWGCSSQQRLYCFEQ